MNWDVGVDGLFFLEAFYLQDVSDGAVVCVELFACEADDFADAQTGVDP